MTLPGEPEPTFGGLDRLIRWSKAAYLRYRRAREQQCLRCRRRAQQVCEACGARVCDRCWVLSIETGSASGLCLDCAAGASQRRPPPPTRTGGAELFRTGMRMLAWTIAGIVALSYWQHGWAGPRRVLIALVEPAILFSLAPLALVLGAIRAGIVRLARALVSDRPPRLH